MDLLAEVVRWFSQAEHWHGEAGLVHRTYEHVWMAGVAVTVAVAAAVPVGLVLGHLRRGGVVAVNVSNVGRAIPSFALLVLSLQVFGFGSTPTYVALVALAIPPILTNTYVGIAEVDTQVREAARGMGMTGMQLLRRVELPLGLPLVMAGVRTAAVQVMATATLAALIGQGGLGRFIIDGRAQRDDAEVLAGAFAVALLSVMTELGFGAVQRALSPRGLSQAGADPGPSAAPEPAGVH